jgi:hypothetical protein
MSEASETGATDPRSGVLETRPSAMCESRHPLLEDLQCQRLKGHPGKHGAAVDSSSTELTMEWTSESGPSED